MTLKTVKKEENELKSDHSLDNESEKRPVEEESTRYDSLAEVMLLFRIN